MTYRYAISDTHGCTDVLEVALASLDLSGDDHLYLLGDYIPHETQDMTDADYEHASIKALSYVREFAHTHAESVTVLCGNHERYLLLCHDEGRITLPGNLYRWVSKLPPYVETEQQVFVHAGIDEEIGDFWRWGSSVDDFCGKYPATFGRFEKDIVAGHVSAAKLAHRHGQGTDFEGVFWDGESHYYIDGTTERSGKVNILRYDVARGSYLQCIATATGVGAWQPIDPIPC